MSSHQQLPPRIECDLSQINCSGPGPSILRTAMRFTLDRERQSDARPGSFWLSQRKEHIAMGSKKRT